MKRQQFWKVSRSRVLLLGVTVALLIGRYGASLAVEPPKTIKIGCSIAFTGPFGIGGGWVKQGYDLAVKHINTDGGIYIEEFKKKIPLEILYVDNESDPVKATRRMDKLYSVDKVDVFLGGFSGNLINPQLAVAENYKTPIIVTTMPSEGPFEKGYKYIFTPFVSDLDMVTVFLDLFESIPKDQRPRKLAYFGAQEEAQVVKAGYFKELAPKRNIEMAPIEMFSLAAMDFSSLIINAKKAEADALFTIPAPPQGIRLIKQMKELDWSPRLSLISRASDDNSWSKNLGKDGDYVLFLGSWDFHLKLPGVEKFNEDYKSAYGTVPEAVSGTAYTCVQILADALRRAGTLEKVKVRDAIVATNMMTIMGPMKFKPNGRGEGKYQKVVTQWQNGKKELVWPTDQASAPLAYPMPPWNKR